MKPTKSVIILLLSLVLSAYVTDAANKDEVLHLYSNGNHSDEVENPTNNSLSYDLMVQLIGSLEISKDSTDQLELGNGSDFGESSQQNFTVRDRNMQPVDVLEDPPQEILLPDLQNLPPSDLRLTFDRMSGGKYIRFTTQIWNSGPGKVELVGQTDDFTGRIMVKQQLFDSDAQLVSSLEVGEFVYHPLHYHMHLENFALYEVWSIKRDFSLDTVVASGGKISYCVMDVEPIRLPVLNKDVYPEEPVYTNCAADFQGLSPGWIDVYEYSLPDQWVDITDLSNGIYAVVSTVNPDQNLMEKSLYNNRGVTYFILEDFEVKMIRGPLESGHLQQ